MRNGKQPEKELKACAIYVRKSTTENLDMDFNSLDAQREACEAYIKSQQAEGWIPIEKEYSDGGFSGGNMDRPGLKELMADIEDGLVDIVVVYKVDRLSRSLMDFSKIITVFDEKDVSFVSVTQAFNTTNSMGRLTLNILLSFAQFERELISERTSDKMAAARRKGKWVGGMPMLGYDVAAEGGRLIVNEAEAEQVREIFELYLQKRSLLDTARELNARGWTTKTWRTKKGSIHYGHKFSKNNVYSILRNVIYTGKIAHKEQIYEGEHERIVDEKIYTRVNAIMHHNSSNGGIEVKNKYGALLRGILFCEHCKSLMYHTYSKKNRSKRYRYYVCERANKFGWETCPNKSLPAPEIEEFIIKRVMAIGGNDEIFRATLKALREQHDAKINSLDNEERILDKELRIFNEEVNRLVAALGKNADEIVTKKLAKQQELVQGLEIKLRSVQRRKNKLLGEIIDEEQLRDAVGRFDSVWEALSLKERARVIKLLVERVGYDGEKGKVHITFRSDTVSLLEANEQQSSQQEERP